MKSEVSCSSIEMLLMSGDDVVLMMMMSMMRMIKAGVGHIGPCVDPGGAGKSFRSKQESVILGPVRIRGEPGNPSGASRSR